jgi:hypothetical protein
MTVPLTEVERQANHRARYPSPTSRAGKIVYTCNLLQQFHDETTANETTDVENLSIAYATLVSLKLESTTWLESLPRNYEENDDNADRADAVRELVTALEDNITSLEECMKTISTDLEDQLQELSEIIENLSAVEVPRFRVC